MNACDVLGATPLMKLCEYGTCTVSLVESLLKAGARTDIKDTDGKKPTCNGWRYIVFDFG